LGLLRWDTGGYFGSCAVIIHNAKREVLQWHFAIVSPIPLGISMLLGPIVGGYTGIFLGTESRWAAFSGAVLWIVVVITLMTFIPSLLALRITRSNKSTSEV
jgi:membrane protein YdbS with pleckstrin-like domain